MVILDKSDFGDTQAVGGATGSVQAKHSEGWKGQLKPSIKSKGFFSLRRRKVGGLDVENFGELIGAKIAYSLAGDEAKELVPEVSFVVDGTTKQVGVVSKYLDKVEGPLHEDRDTQLIITATEPKTLGSKTQVISQNQKTGICKAIALSIMVGDHDINPGNLLKIKEDKIARIDYGHAFNDMLSQSSVFGGQVRNKKNQVLDFLNRERVNTIKLGDSTKLWRSYENLIPSQEMARAMKEMADAASKITAGVTLAKKDFEELLEVKNVDKKHILKSLAAVANNLGGRKVKIDMKNYQKTLDAAFNKIEEFSKKQAKDMEVTAELMKFQLRLDQGLPIEQVDIDQFNKIATKENGLRNWRGQINWIKTSKDEPAFVGSIEDYLKKSGLSKEKIKKILPPKPSIMDRVKNFIQSFKSGHAYEPVSTTRNALVKAPEDVKNFKKAKNIDKVGIQKALSENDRRVYTGRYGVAGFKAGITRAK